MLRRRFPTPPIRVVMRRAGGGTVCARSVGALVVAALLCCVGVPFCVAGTDDAAGGRAATSPASSGVGAPVAGAKVPPRGPGVFGGVRYPSGLPWASGVFSHDADRTRAFERARAHPVDVLAVYPTRDSWPALLEDWWMSPSAVPDGFTGTLNVGLPLFPSDGSLEAAASGAYDEQWRRMGALIASRYPDAWVRPGWEMNIGNWPWSANPGNVEQYKEAFRRASQGLRAGGPRLRIVFNPNEGRGDALVDARDAYPGDEYVDDIGIDAYDWDPGYTPAGWEEHRTKDQGWDFWAAFARSHGKTFSVPEWGVIPGGENSGGDNPGYVRAVLTWMGRNADIMSFDTYFEEPEPYCRCALSLNPAAQEAYTSAIGALAGSAGVTSPAAAVGAAADVPRVLLD